MKPILVQMADVSWTTQAMHLASAFARSSETELVLLRLIRVQHTGYLGTSFAHTQPTPAEDFQIYSYAETAEDYGVVLSVANKQCTHELSALVEAADQTDAQAVFACVPASPVPYWQRFKTWNLRRELAKHGRLLFTLSAQDQTSDQVPTITTTSTQVPIGK